MRQTTMRQKEVFKSSELAHVWANQSAPHGYCPSSMRFDGPAFYSYATVIARIIKHKGKSAYVVDGETFSSSTSKHQGAVRHAIRDAAKVFTVYEGHYGQSLDFTPAQLRDHYLNQFRDMDTAGAKSRYEFKRAQATLHRHSQLDSAIDVCQYFGLGFAKLEALAVKTERERLSACAVSQQYSATIDARRAARDLKRKARQAERDKQRVALAIDRAEGIANGNQVISGNDFFGYDDCLLESRPDLLEAIANARQCLLASNIDAWRQGAINGFTGAQHIPVMIREEGGEMVTSYGARVPLVDAKRTFRFVMLQRARGWRSNGEKHAVGMYHLDAVNEQGVIAGCHRVAWEEIERFAKLQGWL